MKHTGFTLIELIVVIGVILIISVLTILNYNLYTDKQKVKQAGLTLRTDLRLARTKATSGQKTALCVNDSTLEGYDIDFLANCNGKGPCYTTKPVCSQNGTAIDTSNEISYQYLPAGITFGGTYPIIRFFTVTGVTDLTGDQIIVLSGKGGTYSVSVTQSGVISDYNTL